MKTWQLLHVLRWSRGFCLTMQCNHLFPLENTLHSTSYRLPPTIPLLGLLNMQQRNKHTRKRRHLVQPKSATTAKDKSLTLKSPIQLVPFKQQCSQILQNNFTALLEQKCWRTQLT